MIEAKLNDSTLRQAASQGIDNFLEVIALAILQSIGGELNSTNMSKLNADQVTLLAYRILHEEVMDGGFIQLIHNGYGGFIFHNPFAKMLRMWGIPELTKLINKAHKLYNKYHEELEKDCSDDEFMALFERYSQFDSADDFFVENEEEWTEAIALYVDNNLEKFVTIIK